MGLLLNFGRSTSSVRGGENYNLRDYKITAERIHLPGTCYTEFFLYY